MRYAVILVVLTAVGVIAQDGTLAPIPTEFEVASIKRNTSGDASSNMRSTVNGQQVMVNITARTLITQAFPSRGSALIIGLPAWVGSEHYDVEVKTDRRRPREEQAPLWRKLLADRMKLAAHYEMREEPSYDLVFARADRRLGPQLKPSTCAPLTPPAPVAQTPCGFQVGTNRIAVGRTTVAALARLLSNSAGRFIVDKTGLEGAFDVDFSFEAPQPGTPTTIAAAVPNDTPDFFTAVQEQLGLKLVGSTAQVEVLVIDHVERPAEN
jgi:uncharacterized protein (TIGR03435 family)